MEFYLHILSQLLLPLFFLVKGNKNVQNKHNAIGKNVNFVVYIEQTNDNLIIGSKRQTYRKVGTTVRLKKINLWGA